MKRLRSLFESTGGQVSFRGAVLMLLSSSSLAVGLAFLAQPILTRLYDPVAFGTLDAFIAIVAVLAPVISFRYEDALMLPESDDEAAHVFWLTSLLVLLMTVVTAVIVFLLHIVQWGGISLLAEWGWFLPLAVLAFRGQKLFEYWFTRKQRFGVVAAGQLSHTVIKTGLRIGLGTAIAGIGAVGLFGGYFAGLVFAVALYLAFMGRGEHDVLLRNISWEGIRRAAIRYKRFPLFSASSQVFYALSTRIPFLLLLAYFGEAVVGQYGRAFVVLAVPMSMLGASVARVYKIRGVEINHTHGLAKLTGSLHAKLVYASLFPAIAVIVAGPVLLGLFFGEEWAPAGRYLRYVGPWLLFAGLASPLTPVFDILERQKEDLQTGVVLFILPAAALFLGGYLGQVTTTLLLVGIAGMATRLFHLNRMLALAGVTVRDRLQPYSRAGARSAPFLLAQVLALYFLPAIWAAGATMVLIALYVLLFARSQFS